MELVSKLPLPASKDREEMEAILLDVLNDVRNGKVKCMVMVRDDTAQITYHRVGGDAMRYLGMLSRASHAIHKEWDKL